MSDDVTPEVLTWFCRQVRARSHEHQQAMAMATQQGWLSIAVGILRQELDSMVRVIFLIEQPNPGLRVRLLEQAVSGERWKVPTSNGKLKPVTDRDMVDLAQHLHGWTQLVYRFGCSFIHLSDLHDYHARDPFRDLPLQEREDIAQYLRKYHGSDVSADSTFEKVVAYVPKVLDKIASNLEVYLNDLEQDANYQGIRPRQNDKLDDATIRRAAVMWAFVVQHQAARLYEAVSEFNKAQLDQYFLNEREAGRLSDDWESYIEDDLGEGMSWRVIWTVAADQYFFLLAAAQLRKCALRLPNDGLPAIPDNKMIRLLRNFTEHWENPSGVSAVEIRKMIPDATPGRLEYTKKDVWIEGVSMYDIVNWSIEVMETLHAIAAQSGEVLPYPYDPSPDRDH